MGERCSTCATLTARPLQVTMLDTGGGLHVPFCRSCWRRLDRRHDVLQGDVCVVCADHADPGRARGMYDVGDRDECLHVCDACRIDLIRERQTAEVVGL